MAAFLSTTRYAVVTGANKGIGLEICRQLASRGVVVVLTARDEKRGVEALEKLKKQHSCLGGLVEFRQVDVTDQSTVASLADFVKSKFGKLDILVNNAGRTGSQIDADAFTDSVSKPGEPINFSKIATETYELAGQCLETNYYGVKRLTEALLPLLQLSDAPRIVNISSGSGRLKNIPGESIRTILEDTENLTEDKIDEILNGFLQDMKRGELTERGWPSQFGAYILSKAAVNSYTRITAKEHPDVEINSVCPGYVRTDLNYNTGSLSVEEGAESPVRLALLPKGEVSGTFFVRKVPSPL